MKKIILAIFLLLTMTSVFAQGDKNTWSFKADFGAQTTFNYYIPEVSDQALSLDLGLGYNFSKYLYLGVASTIGGPMGTCSTDHFFPLPVSGDITVSFPNSTMFVPFIQTRGGYAFNMTKEYTMDNKTLESTDYITFDSTVGLIARFSEHQALRFGVMYQRWISQKDGVAADDVYGHNLHFMGGKIGYMFIF